MRTLAPAPSARGGAWSADGTILYVPHSNNAVLRVSDKGGASAPVTSLELQNRQLGHRWPVFVDSRRFLYTVQGAGDTSAIYLASLDSPVTTRLVDVYSNPPSWMDTCCSCGTAR